MPIVVGFPENLHYGSLVLGSSGQGSADKPSVPRRMSVASMTDTSEFEE
jgi:hypothetical protein